MSLHVVVAGIHNKRRRRNRWGVGDRHQGKGYDALYGLLDARSQGLLTLSPFGRSVPGGAAKVARIGAGDRKVTRMVRDLWCRHRDPETT